MRLMSQKDFQALGRQAAIAGVRDRDCPLEQRTIARKWWMEGYREACEELRQTRRDLESKRGVS